MASTRQVGPLLNYHTVDRTIYEKFLAYGVQNDVARDAVCLFMWLDQIGMEMVNQIVDIKNRSIIASLIAETRDVYACAAREDDAMINAKIPFIQYMSGNRVNMRFLHFCRDLILEETAIIRDGIGRHIVFNDYLYGILRNYQVTVRRIREEVPVVPGRRPMVPSMPRLLAMSYDPITIPVIMDACRPEDFTTGLIKDDAFSGRPSIPPQIAKWHDPRTIPVPMDAGSSSQQVANKEQRYYKLF